MTTCYCARLLHGGFYCPGKAPTGPRHYWEGQVQIWWSNSWPQHPPESHPPVTIGSFRKRWVAGSKVPETKFGPLFTYPVEPNHTCWRTGSIPTVSSCSPEIDEGWMQPPLPPGNGCY